MNLKELRIGLWVYLFGDAVQLTDDHLVYLLARNSTPEPIPLTEDWLLKFGFVFKLTGNEVYDQIWEFDQFKIWQHDEGFCHSFHHGGDLDYVHQIQTLYFALTGEELTIK